MKTILEAKVAAQNLVNAEANRLSVLLNEAWAPFVGQKVLRVDGTIVAKLCAPEGPVDRAYNSTGRFHVYRYPSDYTLVFVVKASVPFGEHGCVYAEQSVRVGELEGQILKSLLPVIAYCTDYSAQSVIAARERAAELRKEAQAAECACSPFGLYDQ